jgi:hypothetical protein
MTSPISDHTMQLLSCNCSRENEGNVVAATLQYLFRINFFFALFYVKCFNKSLGNKLAPMLLVRK